MASSLPRERLFGLVLIAFVTIANLPAFRIGFFADDFIFFDAVRRMNVIDVLLGRYGIYPWYRPLSRELFFYLLLAFEPVSLFLSHAFGLAAITVSAWCLHRIGGRLFGVRVGVVAAALFATAHLTRFVSAWASTFQDNLAIALTLGAMTAHMDGRSRWTLVLAGTAPFAKETGILVWPLMIAAHLTEHRRLPDRRWFASHAVLLAGVVAVHGLIRLSWVHTGSAFKVHPSPAALLVRLQGFAASYAPWGTPPLEALPIALGLLAAGLCVGLLALSSGRPADAAPARVTWRRALGFAVLALGAGLAPLTLGHLLAITGATTYYSYPAVPWGALVAAALLVRLGPAALLVVPTWVLLSVWGLTYRAPGLDRFSGWLSLDNSTWWEEVRVSAATDRMRADLTRSLAQRAESTVVLYSNLPFRSFFQQSGDGPATREMLRDPTVAAFFVSSCPRGVHGDRMAMMVFDPERCHLRLMPRTRSTVVGAAAGALAGGFPLEVWPWLEYGGLTDSPGFDVTIVRATARLATDGPAAYRDEMTRGGLTDTVGEVPARLALDALATGYPAPAATLEWMLRHPSSASAHTALAEVLVARGAWILSGIEARTALMLGGSSCRLHYLLGHALARRGLPWNAADEFREALGLAPEEPYASLARVELADAMRAERQMTDEARAAQRRP